MGGLVPRQLGMHTASPAFRGVPMPSREFQAENCTCTQNDSTETDVHIAIQARVCVCGRGMVSSTFVVNYNQASDARASPQDDGGDARVRGGCGGGMQTMGGPETEISASL